VSRVTGVDTVGPPFCSTWSTGQRRYQAVRPRLSRAAARGQPNFARATPALPGPRGQGR